MEKKLQLRDGRRWKKTSWAEVGPQKAELAADAASYARYFAVPTICQALTHRGAAGRAGAAVCVHAQQRTLAGRRQWWQQKAKCHYHSYKKSVTIMLKWTTIDSFV